MGPGVRKGRHLFTFTPTLSSPSHGFCKYVSPPSVVYNIDSDREWVILKIDLEIDIKYIDKEIYREREVAVEKVEAVRDNGVNAPYPALATALGL